MMPNDTIHSKLDKHLSYLHEDKHNLSLLLDISSLYIDLEQIETAQEYLTQASAINPKSTLGHQGLICLKQGQIENAKILFEEALDYCINPELQYYLGFTYYMLNQLDRSWTMLSAIDNEDYLAQSQLIMTRILYQQNNSHEALDLLNQHLKLHPNDAEALGLSALIHFDNDEEDLAQEFCQRALMIDPHLYDAQIVDIMLRLPKQEVSAEELTSLLVHNPNDTRLLFALASVYMAHGDFSSAITYYQQTLAINPDFYDCYIALAWCYLLTDEPSNAHEIYQQAILLADHHPDAWGGLAFLYALNTDLSMAEQLIAKTHSLSNECFLAELAQELVLIIKQPKQKHNKLSKILIDQETPISEKIALLLE